MKLTENFTIWASTIGMALAISAFEYILLTMYGISAGTVVL